MNAWLPPVTYSKDLPTTASQGDLELVAETNSTYCWNSASSSWITGQTGPSTWGMITGNIANQFEFTNFSASGYLPLAGGTLQGPLYMAGNAVAYWDALGSPTTFFDTSSKIINYPDGNTFVGSDSNLTARWDATGGNPQDFFNTGAKYIKLPNGTSFIDSNSNSILYWDASGSNHTFFDTSSKFVNFPNGQTFINSNSNVSMYWDAGGSNTNFLDTGNKQINFPNGNTFIDSNSNMFAHWDAGSNDNIFFDTQSKTIYYPSGNAFVDANSNLYARWTTGNNFFDTNGKFINYPNGNTIVDSNSNLYAKWDAAGSNNTFFDTQNKIINYPNNSPFVDSNSNLFATWDASGSSHVFFDTRGGNNQKINYPNGNTLVDSNSNLFATWDASGSPQTFFDTSAKQIFYPGGGTFVDSSDGLYVPQKLYDHNSSQGSVGLSLQSTGTQVVWAGSAARIALTGQAASISTTTILTPSASGEYAIEAILTDTTAGAAGTVFLTIGWTDENGSRTMNSATLVLTSTGSTTLSFPLHSTANAITYATTVVGLLGAQYSLYINLMRRS